MRIRAILLPALVAAVSCDGSPTEPGNGVGAPATLAIRPYILRVLPGDSLTVEAEVRDAAGRVLATDVSWSSRDPDIATIAADGRLLAHATGWTVLRGSVQGPPQLRDSVWLAVSQRYEELVAGDGVACGITDAGDTYCWGQSLYLMDLSGTGTGPGPGTTHETPHFLTADAASITLGEVHACRITRTAAVYCWGRGYHGELGTGALPPPAPVVTPEPLVAVAASPNYFACGRSASGRVFCWGFNEDGQLGVRDEDVPEADRCGSYEGGPCSKRPIELPGLRLAALSVGLWHACGLDADGVAYCWGYNGTGAVGVGVKSRTELPQAVQTTVRFREIVAFHGSDVSWALTADGRLYQWGAGVTRPEAVNTMLRFHSISSGCAVTDTGALHCLDREGHLEPVVSDVAFQSVVAASGLACALSIEGAAYCWGSTVSGTGLPLRRFPVMVAPPGPVPTVGGDQ